LVHSGFSYCFKFIIVFGSERSEEQIKAALMLEDMNTRILPELLNKNTNSIDENLSIEENKTNTVDEGIIVDIVKEIDGGNDTLNP